MSVIDVEALLAPVGDESPAGANLEYDPAVLEVIRLAEGTPERVMGGATVPAEEPDWRRVQAMCVDILRRSKDLRVSQLLLRALVRTASLPGLNAGIQLLVGLIDRYWDSLYPALDSADNNDPTERMNLLASLTDPTDMLTPMRDAPLLDSKVFGRLSLRDIEVAEGKARPNADEQPLEPATVNAAFMDCDLEQLAAYTNAASSALEQMRALGNTLANRVDRADIPNFDPFLELLSTIATTLQARLAERQPSAATAGDAESAAAGEQSASSPTRVAQHDPTHIASREDVVRVLDALCDYYRRNEPSSPVPLLLQRARRLATKDFLDIMRDLVPEAMDKVDIIKGPDSSEP
jgi:type VI secretion system protein ImpA